MAHRLLAFALACCVIGTPLAGQVCGVLCASTTGSSRAVHQHHHHSDVQSPPAGGADLRPVSHECAQLDGVVTDTREVSRTAGIAAAVTVARIAPSLAGALPSFAPDSRHGPPVPIRSASPLRI